MISRFIIRTGKNSNYDRLSLSGLWNIHAQVKLTLCGWVGQARILPRMHSKRKTLMFYAQSLYLLVNSILRFPLVIVYTLIRPWSSITMRFFSKLCSSTSLCIFFIILKSSLNFKAPLRSRASTMLAVTSLSFMHLTYAIAIGGLSRSLNFLDISRYHFSISGVMDGGVSDKAASKSLSITFSVSTSRLKA